MNEEYQYEIDKYIVGVDKGNSDEIGLTVGYLENEEFYIIDSCYGEQARFIDLLIKRNTELKEENFKLQARSDRVINNWNKLKEYMTKEQARIVIENTNEDEFVYTDLLIKMQEIEGGINE